MRSLLFIPAIFAPDYLRALSRQDERHRPDAVILDLEDSIPEQRKDEARGLVHQLLGQESGRLPPGIPTFVRINGFASPFVEADLRALSAAACWPPPGIVIAKCSREAELDWVRAAFAPDRPPALLPLIETLAGHAARDALCARASHLGCERIAFGAGDMSLDLGIERDYGSDLLRQVAVDLVIAARRHGLEVIDSPARAIPDGTETCPMSEIMANECEWARRNGMRGKLAIHPAQIPFIARAFDPGSRLERARVVIEEFERHPERRSLRLGGSGEYMGTPTLKQAQVVVDHWERREPDASEEQA